MHVDDLRDLTLIKQGKLELHKRRIELASTIERAIDVVDAATRHRPRTLEVTQLAQPVYLDADPARIEQVFVKLLMNSSRFTGPGGYIWLEVQRHGDEVTISVRDDGEGIAGERLPRDAWRNAVRVERRAGQGQRVYGATADRACGGALADTLARTHTIDAISSATR